MMFSGDDPTGPNDNQPPLPRPRSQATLECELFESLMHHLFEKGILTKNDTLSVIQTVAQVRQGLKEEPDDDADQLNRELAALKRLYLSFELLTDRPITAKALRSENVVQLRHTSHGENPGFPSAS
jgi:hypothetical protein